MERFLITQSLISAWEYTFDCYEGSEDEAWEDFMRVLRREKDKPTEAMLNGIEFETLCYNIASGAFQPGWEDDGCVVPSTGEVKGHPVYPRWYNGAHQIAQIIKGAPTQVKASRPLEVDGIPFLVYGVLDALKAGTIYDVKFTSKSLGGAEPPHLYGKYLSSAQHPAYFYIVPDAMDFKYLLSDGEDLYIEQYRREDTRFIGDIIYEFIESIKTHGLLDIYREKWQAL